MILVFIAKQLIHSTTTTSLRSIGHTMIINAWRQQISLPDKSNAEQKEIRKDEVVATDMELRPEGLKRRHC